MADGRLFYVVGPSGCGKDSLMRYARERLAANPRVVFAHRYITRPADAGGENHVALSEHEFAARLAANLFALHWESHGCRYGIGREIDMWLDMECYVVVNGSREHLQYARQHYPALTPVWIAVSPHVLEQRLRTRGRESEEEIGGRLQRAASFIAAAGDPVIWNDGPLQEAGEQLARLVSAAPVPACA